MTLKNRLLILCGFILLAVVAVGIFVPVLPTTPFVLAAAGCFSGSPALRGWLMKSKLFGDYIANYQSRAGLKKRTVTVSLVFLWATLSVSAACIRALWAYILMPLIGIAVTIHILYMARPRNAARRAGEDKANGHPQ